MMIMCRLLPDEEKTITLKIDEKYLANKAPEIYLEGWNTEPVKMDLLKNPEK